MTSSPIRTLFLARSVHPPAGGPAIRNYQNINVLKRFGPVGIFCVSSQFNDTDPPAPVDLWSYTDTSAQPSLQDRLERWIWQLRQRGRPTKRWPYLSSVAKKLDTVLSEFQPDLVIFEQLSLYHYLPIVRRHNCRVILDEHNVEAYLFQETWCAGQDIRSRFRAQDHLPLMKAIEKDFIEQADQVWVCSTIDQAQMEEWFGRSSTPSALIPNGINLQYYDCIWSEECERPPELDSDKPNVLFLGTLSYLPNTEAVQILLEQIYPKLQQRQPDCRLLLVGRDPTPMMQEAARQDPSITITGKVPDVRPYLAAADLLVVPLFKGSGTRLKILEAFAAGCPVVSTAKGAEGIEAEDGEHLLIRDAVESLTEGVMELWKNPALKQKITDSAYKLAQTHYSWDAIASNIETAVQPLLKRSADH